MERNFITKHLMLVLLVVLFLLYSFLSTYMISYGYIHLAVVWNLFLSALPLVFAFLAQRSASKENSGAYVMVFSFLWFIFFPNAPYMITDFIHVSNQSSFYLVNTAAGTVSYNMSIGPWLSMIHVATGVLCGVILGLFSLYMMHNLLLKRRGKIFSSLAIGGTCLLSGFAIYIGRFLRLNSWDILRPLRLIGRIFSELSWFTLEYCLLMAGFIIIVYLLFFLLCRIIGTAKNE